MVKVYRMDYFGVGRPAGGAVSVDLADFPLHIPKGL